MVHFGLGGDTSIAAPDGELAERPRAEFCDNPGVDRRYTITEPAGPPPPPDAGLENKAAACRADSLPRSVRPAAWRWPHTKSRSTETAVQPPAADPAGTAGAPALAIGGLGTMRSGAGSRGHHSKSGSQVLVSSHRRATALDTPAGFTPPAGAVDDGPVLLFEANWRRTGGYMLVTKRAATPCRRGHGSTSRNCFPGRWPRGLPACGTDWNARPPSRPVWARWRRPTLTTPGGKLGLFLGGRVLTGEYPLAPRSALLANRGAALRGCHRHPGARPAGGGHGDQCIVERRRWGRLAGPAADSGVGPREVFPQRAGPRLHRRDGKSGLRFRGHRVVDCDSPARTSTATAGLDYVAGNVGLNTQYHADAAHPALLFSGDFKGDGSNQLIEGYYEEGKLHRWRSRRDTWGSAIPSPSCNVIPKPISTPGRAWRRSWDREDAGPKADRFAATELRSGVFLSQPRDGTYRTTSPRCRAWPRSGFPSRARWRATLRGGDGFA